MRYLALKFATYPSELTFHWACVVNCTTMMIRIEEEKQGEHNTQILHGSIMCLHPWERRLKISLSLKKSYMGGVYL